MKWKQEWRWMLAGFLLVVGTATGGRAEDVVIQSFDGTGSLTFNEITNAFQYRVEWAPSPGGPWRDFLAAAEALDGIVATGSGIVTCSVPMCYRVVATMRIGVQSGMVLIPGGTNTGNEPDYGVEYSLTVSSFYMDRYEVTTALWDEVYAWAVNNGYGFDNGGSRKAAYHPVHTVNWYDVVKWCNARSEKEGRTPVYTANGTVYRTGRADNVIKKSGAGYRLPTEVEWEYAARGGVANRRFPWGDTDTIQHSRANYDSDIGDSYDTSPTRGYHPTYNDGVQPYTSPVGSFAPNGYGLYDMAGNVWEWCFDWEPGHVGESRKINGGSWTTDAEVCLVNLPGGTEPNSAFDSLGFRAVLPLGQ